MKDKENDSHLRLVLSIQSPSVELAWMEGFAYGQNHYKDTLNPYHQDTRLFHFWSEGWEAGFFNESPLFPEYAVDIEQDTEAVSDNVTQIKQQRFEKWYYAIGALACSAAIWAGTVMDLAAA